MQMKFKSFIVLLAFLLFSPDFVRAADDPKVTGLLQRADQALQLRDIREALRLATEAITVNTNDLRAHYFRGRIYEIDKQYAKALPDYDFVMNADTNAAPLYQRRGEIHFRLGQFNESVADFDKFIEKIPDQAPQHWQRGISLYYAKRYEEGAKQFEAHRKVNPNDVENAVWHYLCVLRSKGEVAARKTYIPIEGDSRVPMMQIYALFGGKASVSNVFDAAQAGNPGPEERKMRLFYANLYVGLYYEAKGDMKTAREHIYKAAGEYAVDGYMGDVARVHAAIFRKEDAAKK